MDDLISRKALIERMNDFAAFAATYKPYKSKDDIAEDVLKQAKEQALEMVNEAPTVEARPVVYGEWEHSFGDEWKCSECGDVICTEGSWDKPKAKFCEECGADMRKKVQE